MLGIDSCEATTAGGRQATAAAKRWLDGQSVTLRAEPDVNRDRYGRQLRYVELSSGKDYAESMVVFAHTGVYQGHNDAPTSYVQELRDADPNGRTCSAPAPRRSTSSDDTSGSSSSGSVDWPTPGDQGMRDGALTSGFCKKKWWC